MCLIVAHHKKGYVHMETYNTCTHCVLRTNADGWKESCSRNSKSKAVRVHDLTHTRGQLSVPDVGWMGSRVLLEKNRLQAYRLERRVKTDAARRLQNEDAGAVECMGEI